MSVFYESHTTSSNGNGRTTNGRPSSRIVHFDATLVRKNRMRKLADSRGAPVADKSDKDARDAEDSDLVLQSDLQKSEPATAASPEPPASTTVPAQANVRPTKAAPPPDQLEPFLINFVVEQTGYPPEIVDLDADLEADLGIDSIKKAQLFAELREYFEITPTDDITLDDFPTLRDVSNFLQGTHPKQSAEAGNEPTTAEATVPSASVVQAGERNTRSEDSATGNTGDNATKSSSATDSGSADMRGSTEPDGQVAHGPAKPKEKAPPPEQLEPFLINFVVEQTGYPAEIVEMDADLEADLGIDSIKKAQLFAELREYFEITPTDDITLDDFPTLRDVLNFLQGTHPKQTSDVPPEPAGSNGQAAPESTPAADAVPPVKPAPQVFPSAVDTTTDASLVQARTKAPPIEQLEPFLINFVVEQTGYPPEIVEMDADLEADLGIDSIKKAQLFGELREYFEITPSEDLTLDDFSTLRDVFHFLQGTHPKSKSANTPPSSPTATSDSPTNGQPSGTDHASILTAIRQIIIDRNMADAAKANLTSDTRLIDDVGLDSVGMLDLITAVENLYDISISLEDLEVDSLNRSGEFASLVQRKLASTDCS